MTFASSVRRVELALEQFEKPFRLLGLTTELLPESIAELARLNPGSKVAILSEERYAHQSLGLVLKHAPVVATDVELMTLEATDNEALDRTRSDNSILVHTFGAKNMASSLGIEANRLVELRFDVSGDSLARVEGLLTST